MYGYVTLSMDLWYKTGSDFLKKVTPTSKTSQGKGDLFVANKALLEIIEQQPSTITQTLLAVLGLSQNTIHRYLHKLSLVNRS